MRKWVMGLPCFYCGAKAEGRDHVIALAHGGGKHGRENLVPACNKCNGFKRHLGYNEFKDFVRWWPKAHPLRIRQTVVAAQSLGWRFWGEVHPEVFLSRGIRIPSAPNAPLIGAALAQQPAV